MMARFATIEDLLVMDPHGLGPRPSGQFLITGVDARGAPLTETVSARFVDGVNVDPVACAATASGEVANWSVVPAATNLGSRVTQAIRDVERDNRIAFMDTFYGLQEAFGFDGPRPKSASVDGAWLALQLLGAKEGEIVSGELRTEIGRALGFKDPPLPDWVVPGVHVFDYFRGARGVTNCVERVTSDAVWLDDGSELPAWRFVAKFKEPATSEQMAELYRARPMTTAHGDPLAGQTPSDSASPMPPGVPTHPEPAAVLAARGSLLDALCGVVGVARREGEAEPAWAKRGGVAASRKLVDLAIANDSGPFKAARAAGLRTVCGEAPMLDARDACAVLQYLRDYEHYRGGAKKPDEWAWDNALIDNAGDLQGGAIDGTRMPLAIEAYERARSL